MVLILKSRRTPFFTRSWQDFSSKDGTRGALTFDGAVGFLMHGSMTMVQSNAKEQWDSNRLRSGVLCRCGVEGVRVGGGG